MAWVTEVKSEKHLSSSLDIDVRREAMLAPRGPSAGSVGASPRRGTVAMAALHSGSTRATLRDVAALAGVSIKTVSRVVNGEPGVNEDKVAAVQRAVAQLDYRP